MAQAFQETTKWDIPTKNHIYLLDGNKAIAYLKAGETEPYYFKKPMQIDKRGRTFVEVKPSPFLKDKTQSADTVEVCGSKGEVYHVNTTTMTCSCAGFTFRGTCKHLKMAK